MKLSLIVPCYNEEETIDLMYQELTKALDQLHNYEKEF